MSISFQVPVSTEVFGNFRALYFMPPTKEFDKNLTDKNNFQDWRRLTSESPCNIIIIII